MSDVRERAPRTHRRPAVDEQLSTQDDTRQGRLNRLAAGYREFRARIGRRRWVDLGFRYGVGLLGVLVLALGIVLIPYPGPGWLVVFAGLAILASEFAWAGRVLRFARSKYDGWNAWLRRQSPLVQLAVLGLTGLIVLATLWLLNVGGLLGGWFGLDWPWLRSPFAGS